MHKLATSREVVQGLREALESQSNAPTLRAWLALATEDLSFDEYYVQELMRNELLFLTIDTTGACDLSCPGMCYYHPDIDIRRRPVPLSILQEVIRDAQLALSLKALVFSGKEPLLNPRLLFDLIRYAQRLEDKKFAVGFVTNGRNLARHWDTLTQLASGHALDFMDISIDSGFPEQHDQIRGLEGTFIKAFTAVQESALRLPGVRVSVSSVVRQDNAEGIFELLRRSTGHTRYFNFQPIQPPPFSQLSGLTLQELLAFLHGLVHLLKTTLSGANLEILVALHGIYVEEIINAGFFEWRDLRENNEKQTYAQKEVDGNLLIFNSAVLPEYGWRQARITYDGSYITHAHFLQVPNPEKYAVGNVLSESIVDLYQRGKERNGYAHQLLQSRERHECRKRSCWSSCFGGWTASENSLITQRNLSTQPSLCRKTKSDFILT